MTGPILQLSDREFLEAFPYHFAFDRGLRVVQWGPRLPRLCPSIAAGAPATALFELVRPNIPLSPEALLQSLAELFMIRCSGTGVLLRGQVVAKEDGLHFLFLGSPWFTDASDVVSAGLGLRDFAIHDPGMDMLLVQQAQKTAVTELKQLTAMLTRQRAELRVANDELHRRNQALQEAEAARQRTDQEIRLLSLVASRTGNAVVITDAQGRIVWVNEGFVRITGYALEEVAGRKPGSFLQGPGTDPATVESIRAHLRAARGFQAELLNYSKSGAKYWVSIEVQPVLDERGNVLNYLAIETDTTQQRVAGEALRSEKELLSATLRSIVDGVIVVDEEQRVRLLNPAAEALLGCSSAGVQGRSVHDVLVLVDASRAPIEELLAEAFRTREVVGDIHTLEGGFELRTPAGQSRSVVAGAVPMISPEGRVNGGLVVFRDITVELETEWMRQDFVHAVSHELHTPLTSISGFITTLLRDPDMPPALRTEFLGVMETQATRLRRLVQDILEISRVESGSLLYEVLPLDLRSVAALSLGEVQAQADAKRIRLDRLLPEGPVVFLGDPARLQSVMTNLLTNAIKFSPEESVVQLQLAADPREVTILVRDQGIGIPKQEHTRIFQKFYRVPKAGKQIPGNGLGLSLIRAIAEHYDGRIEVESEPGAGAAFRVHLPLRGRDGLPRG